MNTNEKNLSKNTNYPWVVVAVTFLIGVAGSMVSNKVPPITPSLMQAFQIDLSQAGLLTFAVSLTSLLLAFPAGLLVQKTGVRRTGWLGLITLIAGALIGAMTKDFSVLIASRVIEGFGIAVLTIVPPTAIALWFPSEKSGLPMGIWSTATPTGGFLAMTLAPAMEIQVGWTGVWLASAVFSMVCLLIFMIFMHPARGSKNKASESQPPFDFRLLLSNKSLWLLGFSLTLFSFSFMPVIIYYPTFLNEVFEMTLTKAGLMVGIISLVTLPGAPFVGWLSDKLKTRKWIIVAGYLLLIPMTMLVFRLSEGWIIVSMVLLGLIASSIPTLIYISAPESVRNAKAVSLSIGLITALMNLGTMISIPLFGQMVESIGWAATATWYMVAAVLGLGLILLDRDLK
ncbi:MAG: MFS transporter [Anaerolineaceae bacterium]|nr:MFS transporter [Anaerolineaceae bacterium]